jgi:photosystem II stability/assembly factor-like uncharacterized protein
MIATGHETVRKLYKSTDSGASFAEIGANLPEDANMTSACLVLDVRTYLVARWGWGKPDGIWRTANGGMTWSRVSGEPPAPCALALRTKKA